MTTSPPPRASDPAASAPVERETREVLLGNFAGHLFAAVAPRPPLTLRVGASLTVPGPSGFELSAGLVVAAAAGVPVLIVEVIGRSDEEQIRRIKLPAFRALPGCREIVLVQDYRLYCEVHRRLSGDRWITDLLLDRDARLRMNGAGLELPLSTLYAQTGLTRSRR